MKNGIFLVFLAVWIRFPLDIRTGQNDKSVKFSCVLNRF